MKFHQPRHPIAVIGAGLAGLATAYTLNNLGAPHIVFERFSRPGGRLTSRGGEGWLADHGAKFFHRNDLIMGDLVRVVGMEGNRVAIQGLVKRLKPDHTIENPGQNKAQADHLCFDTGFGEFARRLSEGLHVRYNTPISAVRWDNDEKVFPWQKEGQVFWFEDENNEPVRDPVTHDLVLASGVILATTATQAAVIARRSRSLSDLAGIPSSVQYSPTFTTIFKVPRLHVPFYALEGDQDSKLEWVFFEEVKAPERVDPRYSLIVADASPRWSTSLMGLPEAEAMNAVYTELREIIPGLPEVPISRTYKRWTAARPETEPLGIPVRDGRAQWPVNPPNAPFALAGDYIYGARAEDAARSGIHAAQIVLGQLPLRREFLGLRFAT